jgi:2-methylcitrate dehydratase PrpD
VGGFGAAAAVGRLLDIEPGKLAQALSLSATQAGGLREMFGTMTKPLHPGRAAANGLLSVLLVNRGFTSSSRGLEAPRGFLPVVSEDPDYAVLTEQLGETWQLRDNAFKPYPCGVVTHPVIDGVLRLRRKHQLSPQEVASVTARVHPLVVELTGKEKPETGLEGKFSVYHCAAAALVDGVVLPAQFTDERVQARELAALRERVTTVVDDELREDEAVVELETAADSVLREHVEHATGSKDNPMTAEQLISKFLNLTVPVVGERDAELLVDVFLELPDKEFFEPAVLR